MRQNTQDCVEEGFSCHSFCVAAGLNQLLVFRGYSRPPALPALQHNIVLRCHLQLKKQVCQTLASIAKHSADMAESVVGAELFPRILYKLKEND